MQLERGGGAMIEPTGIVGAVASAAKASQRGTSRQRLLGAAAEAVAANGPTAVSGREIARAAGVHHPQVQQMFGSVEGLVTAAVLGERDRYMDVVFGCGEELPDPLALGDCPTFWRSVVQVVLTLGIDPRCCV